MLAFKKKFFLTVAHCQAMTSNPRVHAAGNFHQKGAITEMKQWSEGRFHFTMEGNKSASCDAK